MLLKKFETEPRLQSTLKVLYTLGLGYPVALQLTHMKLQAEDHSLISLFLPLVLSLLGVCSVFYFQQTGFKSKLIQGFKHGFLLFFWGVGSLFLLAFLDILHCGFPD